jgi:predicted site-specific integrase-resolvase
MCTPLHLDDSIETPKKINFLYSRVSSKKQLDDLSRQTEFLRSYRPEYASYDAITDIASGINFKRRGLQTILDACLQRVIGEVVIAHRDRLCRFGFELVESIV